MSAATEEKYIHLSVIECQKKWNEMWLVMSDNNVAQYNSIKAMDVVDFWTYYDVWRERMEMLKAQYEQTKRKK